MCLDGCTVLSIKFGKLCCWVYGRFHPWLGPYNNPGWWWFPCLSCRGLSWCRGCCLVCMGSSERILFYTFGYWGDNFETDHVFQDFLYLFTLLYGHFSMAMLNRGYQGISVSDVDDGNISIYVKWCWECFKCYYVITSAVVGVDECWFSGGASFSGVAVFRAGLGVL